MTPEDKEQLVTFVTLIGMCIHPVTTESAINYVHGYEAGTGGKCAFTQHLRQLLTTKYRLSYSSDGWPGQIRRLAHQRATTWLTCFRHFPLELIVSSQGGQLTE
jgi:hypothetical protein